MKVIMIQKLKRTKNNARENTEKYNDNIRTQCHTI